MKISFWWDFYIKIILGGIVRTFREKKEEIAVKYDEQIRAIAKANDVDMGVALDMFKSNIMHNGKYPYIKLDEEEARKDFEELLQIAGAEVSAK